MNKRYIHIVGIVALFIAILLFQSFGSFEDATWTKLGVLLGMILIASIGLSLIFNKKQYALNIARIFSGILFIFSGFVKAVDPLGSKYKFIDYFGAWGMDFLNPSALTLGLILSTLELVVGLALLFKIFPRLNSILALLFMAFFTPVTLYLAFQQNISGKELVHDCGCFGDALILTNWQTFVKNLYIFIPVLFTFLYRNKIADVVVKNRAIKVMVVFVLATVGLSIYALKHLPPIDFRPFKVGVKLECEKCSDVKKAPVQTFQYAEFVNNQTGERKEFDIVNNYPDYSIWDYNSDKEIRIVTIEPEPVKSDTILNLQKTHMVDHLLFRKGTQDYTCNIISDTNYVFLFVAYDLQNSCEKNIARINELYSWSLEQKFAFYGATSSLDSEIDKFINKTNVQFMFVDADDIPLKTIVRANPGLVLLKNGVILGKWHHNDYPTVQDCKDIINN